MKFGASGVETNPDVWASDWTGVFSGRLADCSAWEFQDDMNCHRYRVNLAIIHSMQHKEALVAMALQHA